MQKNKVQIGILADDFTGASDAASFLAKGGASVVMYTEIPKTYTEDCDAVVLAMKTRSVSPVEAISKTEEALCFLKSIRCERIYVKYCSTFDSTPQGNIGIVLDTVLEKLNIPYTVLCPSLPVNKRTVKDGVLYVQGVPLSDSSMKDHPLNPMWDSYIPALMKPQSKYPCMVVTREALQNNTFSVTLAQYEKTYSKFYLVPDYETEEDAVLINQFFKSLPVLSGGSGLLEFVLTAQEQKKKHTQKNIQGQALLLCGSCSQTTRQQVNKYKEKGGVVFAIDSKKLLTKEVTANQIFSYVQRQNQPVLVYSDAINQDMKQMKQSNTFAIESKLVEEVMAELSKLAIDNGFTNIVVAGGETSGTVTLRLGFDGFLIGESIDPGVPTLYPIGQGEKEIMLILKSGNFGSENFFMKASGGAGDE